MRRSKTFLIATVLTFSFFIATKVNALTIGGIEINQDFLNAGWDSVIKNSQSPNNLTYHQEDFPLVYCEDRTVFSTYIVCTFLPDYAYVPGDYSNTTYWRLTSSVTSTYLMAPGFEYWLNSHNYRLAKTNNFFVGKPTSDQPAYTNFSIIAPVGIGSLTVTLVQPTINYDPYQHSQLPSYLNGYKKIDLTTSDRYVMISDVTSGSVYIPTDDFLNYGGRLSYYDNDLSSQTYSSYIQDYEVMDDEQFVKQDFDLSQFYGADWVMFSKYIYLEGEDNISYSIWVPDTSYDSQVTITPNNYGGNDFKYLYMDKNGVVQNGQVSSIDLSQYSAEFNSKEGSIYKAKSLLIELKDMNYIWNSSFDIFYNNLPELVQLLLIFFFNIIMILICLKLVGWKE